MKLNVGDIVTTDETSTIDGIAGNILADEGWVLGEVVCAYPGLVYVYTLVVSPVSRYKVGYTGHWFPERFRKVA